MCISIVLIRSAFFFASKRAKDYANLRRTKRNSSVDRAGLCRLVMYRLCVEGTFALAKCVYDDGPIQKPAGRGSVNDTQPNAWTINKTSRSFRHHFCSRRIIIAKIRWFWIIYAFSMQIVSSFFSLSSLYISVLKIWWPSVTHGTNIYLYTQKDIMLVCPPITLSSPPCRCHPFV